MKKKLLVFASISLVLALSTGCGNNEEKSLSCTLSNESDGVVSSSTMNIDFKGNTAEKITLDISIKYPDEYKDYADTFKQTLESQKEGLEDVGYKVDITSGKNEEKLNATGTSKTLSSSESTGSYDATKKSLEESGYVCK